MAETIGMLVGGDAHSLDSNHYQGEYPDRLADKWDELLNWRTRARAENGFFIDQLRARGVRKILDVATGTGFHSLQLLQAGFEVTSVDGSGAMLARAFANALKRGRILRPVHTDWRWLKRDVHDLYDAVICLGNSFAHLQTDNDRRKALAEYNAALRYRGILVLDHRNYDVLLDRRSEPQRDRYYCGSDAFATPELIEERLARFRYEFCDRSVFRLNMFPLRKHYVRRLLRDVGFQRVSTFADFQEFSRGDEPDFFVHVASKT